MGTRSVYRHKKLKDCLEKKLGIDFGSGSELCGWYCLDGKKVLRVTVSKAHRTDVNPRTLNRTIGSLKLTKDEFRDLYRCPMYGSTYEQKIRQLGLA